MDCAQLVTIRLTARSTRLASSLHSCIGNALGAPDATSGNVMVTDDSILNQLRGAALSVRTISATRLRSGLPDRHSSHGTELSSTLLYRHR